MSGERDFQVELDRAMALQQDGKLDEAADLYDRLWERDPTHPFVVFGGGSVAYQQGKFSDAVPLLRKAVLLNPDEAEFHNTLGKALQALGDDDEAARCFKAALSLDPDLVDAHNNLSLYLERVDDRERAIEALRRAVELAPEDHKLRGNLGLLLWRDRQPEEALAEFRTARSLDPDDFGAALNLGDRLHLLGRLDEVDDLAAEIAGKPWAKPLQAAIAGWILPTLSPGQDVSAAHWAKYEAAVAALEDEAETFAEDDLPTGASNFYAAYQARDGSDCQRRIAEFYVRNCPDLTYTAAHVAGGAGPRSTGGGGGRVRVGFVSAHLSNHTVGKLYCGVIATLNRAEFEVWSFSTDRRDDPIANFVELNSDTYVVLPTALAGARQAIASAELDVLFYPDIGMSAFTYFLGFSRLAPVQCVGWGHPVTTGIPAIDYFVSSEGLEVEGAETRYSETLVRFEHPPTYLLRPAAATADPPDMPFAEGRNVYGCVQSLFKVHPDFDHILGQILRRDPNGVVVFLEGMKGWSDILRRRWAKTIPDVAERIHFIGRLLQGDFPGFLAASTVLLDTIHFTGGMTTVESLAAGKAVVTWPNTPLMCGRVSHAYYREVGITDCIAESAEDYTDIAVRLGTDPAYRAEIEARIRGAAERLFERPEVTREYEEFFKQALAEA
ncbi:MAG: tetratricopeptide repeat protein [Alphaproteobacteria bacterium]|nr:tetratricopeptide repeat protein [Alphaproteobacteria bacterium]